MMMIAEQSPEQLLALSETSWNPLAVLVLLVLTAVLAWRWLQTRGERK